MQKFHGNNVLNNQVVVDYVKKTVKFKTANDGITEKKAFFIGFIFIFLIFLITFYCCIVVWIVEGLTKVFVLPEIILLVCVLYIYAFKYLQYYRNYMHPVYHECLSMIVYLITFQFRKFKKYKITESNMKNNKFVVKDFAGVSINYWLYGDFSKLIRKVKVLYHKKSDKWRAEFIFARKPKNGYMEYEAL